MTRLGPSSATAQQRISHRVRSARVNRRPPSFIVTLIALAIVLALAWMFFVRSGGGSPAPVVSGVRGAYTFVPGPGSPPLSGTFGAVASGDAGGDARPDGSLLGPDGMLSAYDAARRIETTFAGEGSGVLRRATGEWPPVWRVATHSPLDYQGLAAIVRAAVDDGDRSVGIKPLKQGDRTVWRAAMTLDGEEITLVVDQATGIVTWCDVSGATFTANVVWDAPPGAGTTYGVTVPAGTPAERISDGAVSYAASPAAAEAAAGYAPLVSDLAPDGYTLKAVATRAAGFLPAGWLALEAENPPAEPRGTAVLQLYTRGLAQFTLEQVGPATLRAMPTLADQAVEAVRGRLSYQETTLQYGAFKGATALTWYQESGPSLFVAGARRAVFVTGALTRQELIAFAEGLQPATAAATR